METYKESNDFDKIQLLIWKNLIALMRKKLTLFFIMVSPFVFCTVLTLARMKILVEITGSYTFDKVDDAIYFEDLLSEIQHRNDVLSDFGYPRNSSVFAPSQTIAWAPKDLPGFSNIILTAASEMKGVEVRGYKDCRKLKDDFESYHFLVGVCFDDSAFVTKGAPPNLIYDLYPYNLNFTLVYPSELRFYKDRYIGATWKNDELYPPWSEMGSRIHSDFDGGYVGYIREGFTYIQAQISKAFIDLIRLGPSDLETNLNVIQRRKDLPLLPPVHIKRMAFMNHDYDPLLFRLSIPISLCTMMQFMVIGIMITIEIVRDKERGLKSTLAVLGVSNWIYFTSHFVTDMFIAIICSFFFASILQVSWNESFKILTKTSYSAMLFILCCYSFVTISFFMMLTAFFSRTVYATFMTPLIWMITFIPCLTMLNFSGLSSMYKLFTALVANCTMGLIWNMIIYRETHSRGLTWGKFLLTDAGEKVFSVALGLLIFLVHAIVNICIAVYLEDFHLVEKFEKKWKKPKFIIKLQEKRKPGVSKSDGDARKVNALYVLDNSRKKLILTVNDVYKEYDEHYVLNDININMYQNEITVIMGHNGSGKTTLFNIMGGTLKPSSGTVMLKNIDIYKDRKKVAAQISTSHQGNRLFDDLTFKEQLYFFGRLKGLTKKQANDVVERYCVHFGIGGQCEKLTQFLSSGLLHILSVCCAIIGHSSVVLIDDFGNGLDAFTRMHLWELLINEKYGRTIMVATNSFESKKVLADRIIILSRGIIQCNGTTAFLKSVYDRGYRLMCIKAENCNTKYVTEFLEHYIPGIAPSSDIGQRITYSISYDYKGEIPLILLELEINQQDLFLESFAIDDRTMEDSFLGLLDENPSDGNEARYKQIMNGECAFTEENLKPKFMHRYKNLTGWKLWCSRMKALMYKRFLESTSSKLVILTFILLPPFLLIVPYLLISEADRENLRPLLFRLDDYPSSVAVLTSAGLSGQISDMAKYYSAIVTSCKKSAIRACLPLRFDEFIFNIQREDLTFANIELIVGALLLEDEFMAVYNNFPYHTAPLALNLVYGAICKVLFLEVTIDVGLDNVQYSIEHTIIDFPLLINRKMLLAMTISFVYVLMYSYIVPFISEEKGSKMKLIQILNGARINTFWLSTLAFDMLKICVLTLPVFITTLLVNDESIADSESLFFLWFSLFLHGISFTNIGYLVATWFNPTSGFIGVIIYHTSGITLFIIVCVFLFPNHVSGHTFNILSVFFPGFNFARMLCLIRLYGDMKQICKDPAVKAISYYYEKCKVVPNCCISDTIVSRHPGILFELIIVFLHIAIGFLTLLLYEYITIWRPVWLVKPPPNDDLTGSRIAHETSHSTRHFFNHDDVVLEQIRVRTLVPFLYDNKALIVQNIGKTFGSTEAVKRLSLMVERHQIFGILGAIGTGKTALIHLLTGRQRLTHGCIYINGLLLHFHPQRSYHEINYAPQVPNGMNNFSPSQILTIFAGLNGVPKHSIYRYCSSLAKVLGFYSTYYKNLSLCSAGIRKRVSLAIALMGETSLIYIDDPCGTVDPGGKRMLHNIMEKLRQNGTAFLISTYSINEAEGTCDRLAILVQNNIWSLGSTADLQRKFGLGYMLILRMVSSGNQSKKTHLQLISRVESMFPGAAFRVRRSNCLYFFLQQKSNTMANIFEKISLMLQAYGINDFAISRCTLETIFMDHQDQFLHLKQHGII